MIRIKKSSDIHDVYYVNGKGFLLKDWKHSNIQNRFTYAEKQQFEEYLKTERNEKS